MGAKCITTSPTSNRQHALHVQNSQHERQRQHQHKRQVSASQLDGPPTTHGMIYTLIAKKGNACLLLRLNLWILPIHTYVSCRKADTKSGICSHGSLERYVYQPQRQRFTHLPLFSAWLPDIERYKRCSFTPNTIRRLLANIPIATRCAYRYDRPAGYIRTPRLSK